MILIDSEAGSYKCVTVQAKTNIGYVKFITDNSNIFEVRSRIYRQHREITSFDLHHATVKVG